MGILAKLADLQEREKQEDAVRTGREKVKAPAPEGGQGIGKGLPTAPARAGLATCPACPRPFPRTLSHFHSD